MVTRRFQDRAPLRRIGSALPVLLLLWLGGAIVALWPGGAHGASIKPPGLGPAPTPSPPPAPVGGTWQAMFQLEPGVTYTYELTYDTMRRPLGFFDAGPGGLRPAPGRTPRMTGELHVTRSGRGDELRFWFEVGGVRGRGVAPGDGRALAGAVWLAALHGPEPVAPEGLRLLAAAFQWMHWYDVFGESVFRDGLVWQELTAPPHRLTAARFGGRRQYWAELTRGRDVVLEMGVDLHAPLPWDVIVYVGRDVYRAELQRP